MATLYIDIGPSPMGFLRLALLLSTALAACSAERDSTNGRVEAPPVHVGATGAAERAEPDDAALALLMAELDGGESRDPRMFVTRTIEGGEAHPRITLAYLAKRDWCGSGGCNLLVIESTPAGAVLLGRITLARPPVRVLASRTYGMPDLGVVVCGGGIMDCHEAVLPFDGRRYASNPTLPPAYRPPSPPDGEVVISEEMVRLTFAGQP